MKEKKLLDLETLSFLHFTRTESVGLGVKKYIFSIIDTPYRLEVLSYKGDEFVAYNPGLMVILKYNFNSSKIISPKLEESSIEAILQELPEDVQKSILFNIDLFI